jgi:hypothetical protein
VSTTEAGRLAAFGKPDSTSQDGISLQAVIEAARRLDELSCARVVGNIASAVHAAQKGGQPLGTVSPAAILVLPDGSVKLVTGAVSPQYTAPEKLRGGTGDRRTDVFTLGIVLWEALAHERLFDGANEGAIKQAVLGGEIRPPSELNANVPAELDAICKKALARDPADRYQSAKVMAAEIDAVLDDAGYPESNEQIARYVATALAYHARRDGGLLPHLLRAQQLRAAAGRRLRAGRREGEDREVLRLHPAPGAAGSSRQRRARPERRAAHRGALSERDRLVPGRLQGAVGAE